LKWAGQDDAAAYKKQLAEERRQSYENRNTEAHLLALVMKEIKVLRQQKDHESMMLDWAAQNDAKEYLADCQEQRRVSLQQRAVEARHHRDIDEENRHEDLAEQANDQLLQAADSRDVKSYKTQLAARDRASLCYRAKEAKLHRLLEESQTIVAKEIEQDNNVLEAQARTDVKIYLAKCKKRNRMSLVGRAAEKRSHARITLADEKKKAAELHTAVRERALDGRYVQLAQERSRAMEAMEALRHKGCTFAVNPFSAWL
ncbi:hypothetical protein ScalyP_jg10801, partial [Parmales sp. scaly parma]